MSKRASENAQQSREDWEAYDEMNKESSEEVLKTKRAIRRSDQWQSLAPSPAKMSTASNPFANLVLPSSVPTPFTSNPFENVALPPPPPPAASTTGRLQELNQVYRAHMMNLGRNRMRSDWTWPMQQYKEYYRAVTYTPDSRIPAKPVAAAPMAAQPVVAVASTVAIPVVSAVDSPGSPESLETVKASENTGSTMAKFYKLPDKARLNRYYQDAWQPGTIGELSLEYDESCKAVVLRDPNTGVVLFQGWEPSRIEVKEIRDKSNKLVRFIQFTTIVKANELEGKPQSARVQSRLEHFDSLCDAMMAFAAK